MTSSAIDKKLDIYNNLEIKLEIYKNLENELEIYSYFKLENKLEIFEFFVNGRWSQYYTNFYQLPSTRWFCVSKIGDWLFLICGWVKKFGTMAWLW